VGAADAQALARWAPSHGALIVDGRNRTSVNFHPLPSGRFAISRTCAGPPEYSGRGGRQLYTHFLIVDDAVIQAAGFQPFTIYRDAIALGYLLYRSELGDVLEPAALSGLHSAGGADWWANRALELGLPPLGPMRKELQSGRRLQFAYAGERMELAECLIGLLAPEIARQTSFSTSLLPSSDRPFVLTLVNEISGAQHAANM
jgi:hypothetical protein